MFRDKKITIAIIIVLMISVIGLGIAFAAFSQTLTINGTGTVESSSWSVVFEGADGSNTIGAPTLTGTATEVTHPTIKNNSTEISNYEVTLKTPGDSVTYNFKIHNKGDYAANLSSLTIAGINKPTAKIPGDKLVTSVVSSNFFPLYDTYYSFYYTLDNSLIGYNTARDCLEPGETVNVSLKLIFSSTTETRSYYLPEEDLVLDNLGITAVYTQSDNGSCPREYGGPVVNAPFESFDYAYYTYEGKSFIGTGVNNIIISNSSAGTAKYASKNGTNVDGQIVYSDHPAKDMAEAYCTGCRLMTYNEAVSWGCPTATNVGRTVPAKCSDYDYINYAFWVSDADSIRSAGAVSSGYLTNSMFVIYAHDVRPAVSIPSTSTMTGSGTQLDPSVITTSN